MNAALVVHDCDPGYGQGRYTVQLARHLKSRMLVWVYASTFASVSQPGLVFQKVRASRFSALSTILTFPQNAQKRLDRQDHSIVHAQGYVCTRCDVITAHICNAARFERTPPRGWRARLFQRLVVPREKRFFQKSGARHLIAISKVVGAEIERCYGWSGETSVIYHGVDCAAFRPPAPIERSQARKRFSLAETSRVWLFAGEASKGLETVLRALPAHPAAMLLVISRSRLDAFHALAAKLQVSQRVIFAGPCEEMAAAYHASDLFVYPSAYDAFGMVVAEAMACGLPVIAGRTIGAAEWIDEGRNGLLCDAGSPDSFQRQIARTEANPDSASQMGDRARETAQGHSWEACADAVWNVYERAANKTP